ncbi:O-antigen ligase family protein [Candidatus Saccharibacteria bacterium]|nr:O-antigen ligase family protein [Candidatus Saccharibacteria bacterium]
MQRLKQLHLYGVLALLAYMPFHLFLSRWLSLYTGGLGIWDASKDLITLALLGISIFISWQTGLYKNKTVQTLFLLIAVYGILHLLFILFDNNDQHTRSWIIATLYNGRILAYLFVGLVAGYAVKTFPKETIIKIILITSTITCFFALVQYALPKDLMEHFGYSIERGAKPSFFIDDKLDFPRVMSTVRDPNSYGAYLILPIVLLWNFILRRSASLKKLVPLLVLHGIALFLTFSRGAWLGVLIAGGFVTVYVYRKTLSSFLKKNYLFLAILAVGLLVVGFSVRNTYVFKNVILHSDESTVMADPNELRVQLQDKAVEDIANDPEGHGPGTAGLASIGNPNGTFLTENYYLQLGYEVGLIGLAIFLTLLALVYKSVSGTEDSDLKFVILATFWAYAFMALLIHLWSNEAVAAQWWLLAGLVIGASISNTSKKKT